MPTIENGGIEKNLILLSDYLIGKGHEVTILCKSVRSNMKNSFHKKVKLRIAKEYIYLNFCNRRINDSINSCIYLWKNRKYFNNYTILSFQSHYLTVIISKIIKLKVILRIANHPLGAVRFFQNKYEYNFKLFLKNSIYKYSDGIVTNSKESFDYFKKNKFKNKLIYIYNPIKNHKKSYKIFDKNKKFILSIGRLEKQKNFVGLLKAFKITINKFNNLKLIIVGSGTEKARIKNYIKQNNLNKNVLLVGYKKSEKYFKKSGLFILNSLFEGLPNVIIEALKYKIPIISTNCLSGPKEILSNGKYGYLVPVDNHYKLAKKIIWVIENYNDALNKSQRGFKSLERFDYKIQCNKYLKFIDKIYKS